MIQSIETGRKEDGNRSIADKIIKRLHDLDKTVENNQGRWAWELLQNAKDSIADSDTRKVSIKITLEEGVVHFSHNGLHFTEQDIRGLINQISSKEVEEGEQTKKTGRFGTGFLTTHLLSKKVHVKGIVETENNEFYTFEFPLDREANTVAQLIPKIEGSWSAFHESTKRINSNYSRDDFNTSFSYNLRTSEQKNIARLGIEEFSKLIPFVFAFIPKIFKVYVIDKTSNTEIEFENSIVEASNFILKITKIINKNKSDIFILTKHDDKVAIAIEVKVSEKGYFFVGNEDIPKLFCDFPLIGTESFHFPMIVNSFYFTPQTERDGIWLKGKTDTVDKEVEENQSLLVAAAKLYQEFLEHSYSQNFYEYFNISETNIPGTNEKYFDREWYIKNIQKPIRTALLQAKIVEMQDSDDKNSINDLYFPAKSYSDAKKEKFWQYTYDLFPNAVCKKSHMLNWCNKAWDEWNKINYSEIASDIAKNENIEKLQTALNRNENETFSWLNSVYHFVLEEETNLALFEKSKIIPNQNGLFKIKPELYIDEINDSDIVNIMELLGEDWKDFLLNKNVHHGTYYTKDKKQIANRISEKLKSFKHDEKNIAAINLLSEWFEHNHELGKEIFSDLYRRRAELFMNTIEDKENLYKVMRSKTGLSKLAQLAEAVDNNPKLLEQIKKAEELNNLLIEFDAKDVEELKLILLNANKQVFSQDKEEFTPEILASLGISSLEELEIALKDSSISEKFIHTSMPSISSFLYAQTLIDRAGKNVLKHLNSLEEYNCDEAEFLAKTVIGGIKRNGTLIHVVTRPSDYGYVIVYYSSEKDSLDYENAELWIDNNIDTPKQLTLGRVLKITGINKILIE